MCMVVSLQGDIKNEGEGEEKEVGNVYEESSGTFLQFLIVRALKKFFLFFSSPNDMENVIYVN